MPRNENRSEAISRETKRSCSIPKLAVSQYLKGTQNVIIAIPLPRERLYEFSRALQGTVRRCQHIGCVARATVESFCVQSSLTRRKQTFAIFVRVLKGMATFKRRSRGELI
jgi:hypothetical protein